MIISPTPRPTTNILHVVNNAYRCVDLAYMFGESEEDCNLWLQKLYWARDPDDPFESPNFTESTESLFLLDPELIGPDRSDSEGSFYTFRNLNGYLFAGRAFMLRPYVRWLRMVNPSNTVAAVNSGIYAATPQDGDEGEAFWKWGLTRSYFPPQTIQLLKATQPQQCSGIIHECETALAQTVRARDLEEEEFSIMSSIAVQMRFGRPRKIRSVLFYRPRRGFLLDVNYAPERLQDEPNDIQLLTLPDYSETFKLGANLSEQEDFTEFEEPYAGVRKYPDTLFRTRLLGQTTVPRETVSGGWTMQTVPREYVGGLPTLVNLDKPLETRELYFRWSGQLSHINFLDVPIVRPVAWSMPEFPGMKYKWPYQRKVVLSMYPGYDETLGDLSEKKLDYIGDLCTTGIRFMSPRVLEEKLSWPVSYSSYSQSDLPFDRLAYDPYQNIDTYTSTCVWYGEAGAAEGDIWELRNFARPPKQDPSVLASVNSYYGNQEYPKLQWCNSARFSASNTHWIEYDDSPYTFIDIRDVGDNKAYVANKAMVGWYYNPLTGTWRSNYGRPSTENQLRFIVTFDEPTYIAGCLNPMSVPAIWNKPRFYHPSVREFRLDPKLFSDYLVPHRVLIEGRANTSSRATWELMDEYTMDHFSTRAHVEFSYPKKVLQIRITIQDWVGSAELIDLVKKDWFYPNEVDKAGTVTSSGITSLVSRAVQDPASATVSAIHTPDYAQYNKEEEKPSDHWIQAGSSWPATERQTGLDLTVGNILNGKMDRVERLSFATTSEFYYAHRELAKWEARTIPSLWHSIYIPPFLFFAGEDDSISLSGDTRDASGPHRGIFTPVRDIDGVPEVLGWKDTLLRVSTNPVTATNDTIQWTVPSHNAVVETFSGNDPAVSVKATTALSVRPNSLIRLGDSAFPRWTNDNSMYATNTGTDEFGNIIWSNHEAKLTFINTNLKPLFADIMLRATIKNGLDYGVDFVKDFILPVVLPLEITGAESGNNYILTWKVPINTYSQSGYQTTYNVEYPYKGFLLECCCNEQFVYFEDCDLYNNCTLGQDCPVYEQCGYWENRQQRAFPARKLARTVKTSTYERQEGQYLFVRVMAVAELPEMNSPWSETFIIPPR